MSEDKQIGITSHGYEVWDNGKGFQWAICRKHNWAFVESYGCSGFNVDEECIGCLVEDRIIKLLENHFDDTTLWRQVEWSPDVYEGFNKQELIALIKGENK